MKKCTELARFNGRSVVEVRRTDTDKVVQYVVCTNFNNSKAFGSKWDWGHYYDVWGNDVAEIQLRNAMMNLYGIDESEISFDRAKEFAKLFFNEYREAADDDDFIYDLCKNNDITEEEAEFLGCKDIIFPKKYKVVEVEFERRQTVKVKVVMPEDEPDYNAENFVENQEYLNDCGDIDSDDWEESNYNVLDNDLSEDDYRMRFDSDDIWNDCDFENL